MIRISVSDLESYRYWAADEDAPLEELLRKLRHEKPPTDNMLAGQAFARFMENVQENTFLVAVDGWSFRFEVDAELQLPPVREFKAERLIQTPSGPVTLVGKADGINGPVVHDQKLTERWDAERYLDSLQWRAYLWMFGASTFTYDVFVGRYKGREVTVTEYHPLTFYAYPGMEADVERAVCELAAVIARHLPERAAA